MIAALVVIGLFCIIYDLPIYVAVLLFIGLIVLILLMMKFEADRADRVVKAELIKEVPKYKRITEHTGFSVGYRRHSLRDHYRYKTVLDYYECEFKVVYKDGGTGVIKCRNDSVAYSKLIQKCK